MCAAVAAAFAHLGVDEDTAVGVGEGVFLAPAAFFGGAGLVVDERGDAFDVAQGALHGVHFAAVVEGGARRKQRAGTVVFLRLVTDHGEALDAFGLDLTGDALDADHAVVRLAAGHGDHVVVENLVGDVGVRGDGLADGQAAGVEVGAVAEVLEHVRAAGEARVGRPVGAFAAHLDQAGG